MVPEMAEFVCAVRGGPGSHHTRQAGIAHAHESGARVHFLSVVDPDAYEPLHGGEQDAIRAEMAWRDLVLARSAATHAGADNARYTVEIRVGQLAPTIAGYAAEIEAEHIMIGTPRLATDAALALSDLQEFADELKAQSGIEVVIVDPGD